MKVFEGLSHTKTVKIAFYLNNEEAKRELKSTIPLDFYIFVQPHLLCGQIAHIPSSSRGIEQKTILALYTAAKTLRTAALSLVYLTAECCAPVWCCSAHTRFIDSVLYDALCIITECLHPNPIDNLPILSSKASPTKSDTLLG